MKILNMRNLLFKRRIEPLKVHIVSKPIKYLVIVFKTPELLELKINPIQRSRKRKKN